MLRRTTSSTSDLSLCAVGHTSDAHAGTGALPARLWEHRAGRLSGLPDASTLVGPECGSLTHLLPEDLFISDALISLHWLWILERIQYKLAVLAYKVLHGSAAHYLGPLTVSMTCVVDKHSVLPMPTTSWYHPSNCQQSAAEPLQLLLQTSGIHCQLISLRQAHCPPSVDC